jgi:hypothetical protein
MIPQNVRRRTHTHTHTHTRPIPKPKPTQALSHTLTCALPSGETSAKNIFRATSSPSSLAAGTGVVEG